MIRLFLLGLTVILVTTATIWSALMILTLTPTSGGPVTFYIIAAALTGARFIPTPRKAHNS